MNPHLDRKARPAWLEPRVLPERIRKSIKHKSQFTQPGVAGGSHFLILSFSKTSLEITLTC